MGNQRRLRVCLAILGMTLLGVLEPSQAAAQEPAESPTEEVVEVEAENEGHAAPAIPGELHDAAFESHVSAISLAEALSSLDPGMLADVSLQLAEGERILGRPNRVTPAERIFALAVRAAAEKGDKQILERLKSRAKELDRDELSGIVEGVLGLAGAARDEDPATKLGLKEGSDARDAFELLLEDITSARLLSNGNALDGIDGGLETFNVLNAEQISYLRELIAKARTGLDNENDAELEAMQKLAGVSRAAQSTVNERVYSYCAGKLKSKDPVMRGECAELASVAFINAGAKAWTRPKGQESLPASEVDYIWGTLIHLSQWNIGSKDAPRAIRGDILQYRDTKWTDGAWAKHHTSVVKSVEQSGKYLRVLQQNWGGKRYTTEGVLWLPGLKAGWIKVYRPIPATRAFSVSIKNTVGKPVSFLIAGKSYSLANGASKTYSVQTSTGNVPYSVGWPSMKVGSLNISQAELGYLEGQRKYEFRKSTYNYSMTPVGWIGL